MKEFLAVALLKTTAYLPLPVLHGLGVLVGRLVSFSSPKLRRITRKNIEACFPTMDEAGVKQASRAAFDELGKVTLEMGWMWGANARRQKTAVKFVENEQLFKDALDSGKGVLILAPHLGAWEMIGSYLAWHDKPVTSMYRPARMQKVDALIHAGRCAFGQNLVPTDGKGVMQVMKALKKGGISGILPDQDPKDSGVMAPFFGIPTNTMTLVPKLAQKLDIEILFAFAERLPWGRGYKIHFIKASDEIRSDDTLIAAKALNQGVEQCVEIAPSQYQWSYKRFKRTPNFNYND